jgi:hypothetical protein
MAVSLRGVESVVFAVTTLRGPAVLTLSGVKRLVLNDFREGNIILNAEVLPLGEADPATLARLLSGEPGDDVVRRLLRGELWPGVRLFRISPSYGCEALALVASVRVEYSPQEDMLPGCPASD